MILNSLTIIRKLKIDLIVGNNNKIANIFNEHIKGLDDFQMELNDNKWNILYNKTDSKIAYVIHLESSSIIFNYHTLFHIFLSHFLSLGYYGNINSNFTTHKFTIELFEVLFNNKYGRNINITISHNLSSSSFERKLAKHLKSIK